MRVQGTVAARVGGFAVPFRGALEDCAQVRGSAVTSVSVSVGLDFADLVAALYLWVVDGDAPRAELANDQYARELVVESVVNLGLDKVLGYRDEVTATPPGVNPALDFCRARVGDLFGSPAGSVRPAGVAATSLVGVA